MPARILVIEDNVDSLELMNYILTAFGHTVFKARNGEEGLKTARRELPDLILSDLQMPKIDGYEVARALREDPSLSRRPLLAVTAFAMQDDRARALAAGFDGYISKPIVPEEFVGQVERFLAPDHRSIAQPALQSQGDNPAQVPFHTTILAVDNSPVNLSLVRNTLGPFGYRVITAAAVSEALALARKNPPDLILSDLHMPDADGYDFFEAVRTEPNLKSIPFVIISSTIWPESALSHTLSMGVNGFILRPIDPQQLVAEIEACLAASRPRPE